MNVAAASLMDGVPVRSTGDLPGVANAFSETQLHTILQGGSEISRAFTAEQTAAIDQLFA